MRIGRILYQQTIQLRWTLLVCFGLVMVLPLEEGIVNLLDGAGFYSARMTFLVVVMTPLLAGLIACVNVQADLDEKRYLFWRSKPMNVQGFMALKYIVGLICGFVIIVSPVIFAFISMRICRSREKFGAIFFFSSNWALIALMAYSLCFLCNVLVRKTARAWLIGMAMTCFLILVPFVLPLDFKDVASDVLFVTSMVYLSITIGVSVIAFCVSLAATQHDWHLRTNLKGLLWAGAAAVFALALLLTRQVANIKVLDEIETRDELAYIGSFQKIGNTVRYGYHFEVEAAGNKVKLRDIYTEPSEEILSQIRNMPPLYPVQTGLSLDLYPSYNQVSYDHGGDTYIFKLNAYYRKKEIGKPGSSVFKDYQKTYLCSYRLVEGIHSIPAAALDLSDCIDKEDPRIFQLGMRRIEDKLVVFIKDSYAIIQIKEDGNLEIVDKKVGGLKGYSRSLTSFDKIFKIPLVPVQGISIEERIKLSLDVNYSYFHVYSGSRKAEDFCKESVVDLNGDSIRFCQLDEDAINRFEVVQWDDQYVYCQFCDRRPFTFLEQMFGQVSHYDPYFVRDGWLYAYENQKLMIFDIRSDRIRKLGHFERLYDEFYINDIEVLDNGNILMCVRAGLREYEDGSRCTVSSLYLLENPE